MRKRNKSKGNYMRLVLPAISVNEGIARAAVAAFCAQCNPNATHLADIKCAVSEAVTNCIVHAYRERAGEIRLSMRVIPRGVRISIRDRGCGIADVRQAREPLFTTDAAGERSGMGFTVMESFMDKLSVHSAKGRGTVVVLTKYLQKEE